MTMNSNLRWTKRVVATGVVALALALAGCGEGGGKGMSQGPVAAPAVDGFTSTVATMARESPEDTAPADIEPIAVVLVDDQPAVTVN
jgi:hypothetical protein